MVIRFDWIALALMALLAALTPGCTTALTYKPDKPGSPSSGGYSEMQFSPDHFQITISATRGTSHKKLEAMAMRRSAEISGQQGYLGFRVIRRTFVDHVYVAGDAGGRVRVTYLPGYGDWRDYWRMFRVGAGVERAANPAWLLANQNHWTFQRDELNFEIKLSRSLGKDIFEVAKFSQGK